MSARIIWEANTGSIHNRGSEYGLLSLMLMILKGQSVVSKPMDVGKKDGRYQSTLTMRYTG